jgi:hypothetical protein
MSHIGEDEYPSAEEQFAFSQAHDLIQRCISEGFPAIEIGKGLLVASLVAFRKQLPEIEISKLLYEYADDYATRHLDQSS